MASFIATLRFFEQLGRGVPFVAAAVIRAAARLQPMKWNSQFVRSHHDLRPSHIVELEGIGKANGATPCDSMLLLCNEIV
jgi:hypothetical protein